MKHLNDVLGQFLGANESIHLGGKAPEVTDQQKTYLIEQLKSASAYNGRIVMILVGLYVAMLVVGFIIVLTLFKEPRTMRAALGGSFLSLIVLLMRLQSVWREKHGMDLMQSLLPALSPEDAMKVVESHYYKSKNLSKSDR
jgi:hypothetical protein